MSFSMEIVEPEQLKVVIAEQIQPEPKEMNELRQLAKQNAASIMAMDVESFERRDDILQSIEKFGMTTIRASSEKNNLLQISVGRLAKSGDEGGQVAKDLGELHFQLKDLDPSSIDFAKSGFLSKIFHPMRHYFQRYQKADVVISEIIQSLETGKTVLKNDNTTLALEQQSMRELTKKLQKEIQLGTLLDNEITIEVEQLKLSETNEEKLRFVTEEVLFPLRQRLMDMQQMLVVNQQGIMAMEVIIRNNKELIRGVDRARHVTISALKIAVTVASALYNQKIVLKKIELLNETTNQLITGTSRLLKEQGVSIQKQALETSVSVETLKVAFTDVLAALESISLYKQEALPKMRESIQQFVQLADVGEKQIERLERGKKLDL